MKYLALNFDKSRWHFEQIKRNSQAAIYKRTNIEYPALVYFETIKILTQDEKVATIAGNVVTFAPQELYPTNQQFGLMGKCCMSIEKAEQYYQEFTKGDDLQGTITADSIYPLNRA